jgi:hypothetical protein
VTPATPIEADLGAASAQTLTIAENEAVPALAVADVTVPEGPSASAAFTVTLSAPCSGPVSVAYATANGTAVAGQDYTATSGTLTIPAGGTSGTVSVPILNDALVEPTETFTLTLSNPSAPVTIARATGQATILDNPRVDIDSAVDCCRGVAAARFVPRFGSSGATRAGKMSLLNGGRDDLTSHRLRRDERRQLSDRSTQP